MAVSRQPLHITPAVALGSCLVALCALNTEMGHPVIQRTRRNMLMGHRTKLSDVDPGVAQGLAQMVADVPG